MTDKEILNELYKRMATIARNGDANVPSQVRFKELKDFIKRERITTQNPEVLKED